MHSLLARQLKKHLGNGPAVPQELAALLASVDESYAQFDRDRKLIEHSLQIASEEMLQSSEDMLAIFRILPDLYCRLASDGVILDCNLNRTDYLLSGPGEVVGRRIQDLVPPGVKARFESAFRAVLDRGEAVIVEYARESRGQDRRYEATMRALPSGHIVAVLHDITTRRAAEGERDRLVTAVEQSAESISITDTHGVLRYVNPAFERLSGYSRDEVIGQKPRLLRSGKHDAAFYERLWKVLRSGEVWRGHFTNRRKDGKLYELDAAISPIFNARREVESFVMVGRDVTRQMQLEEQLRQTQKIESIGRLAGGIAHDFNNLLTASIGHAELVLSRLNPSDPLYEDVEEIKRASTRAAELTSQLLAFGRRQVMYPRALNLNDLIRKMTPMLQRLLGNRIELVEQLAPDIWAAHADPVQIEQAITNLAINAREAMPDGGQLAISTANYIHKTLHGVTPIEMTPGEYVRLTVADTGVGMDEDTRHHLFEPFFSTKEMGKGVGLGLATVYGIVKQSQGHITAESRPQSGATFTLYLPRSTATIETPPRTAVPAPMAGTETVLLVEDEDQVRRLARILLERLGYRVLEASKGSEAIEIARAFDGAIHLMLTDVVMPGDNGDVVARNLTALRPGTRVLFMSGHPDTALPFMDVIANGRRFIQKPFTSADFARKVREVLDEKDP